MKAASRVAGDTQRSSPQALSSRGALPCLGMLLLGTIAMTMTWCQGKVANEGTRGTAGTSGAGNGSSGSSGGAGTLAAGGSSGGGPGSVESSVGDTSSDDASRDAWSGGADGSGDGRACSDVTGAQCGSMAWCSFSGGTCGAGNQQGQCRQVESGNGTNCASPVCGCNGNAYCNEWAAHMHGTDTTGSKSCVPGDGGDTAPCLVDTDCQTGFKCCQVSGASDSRLLCKQVAAGQGCPLVP
jgi:hypothetical protein